MHNATFHAFEIRIRVLFAYRLWSGHSQQIGYFEKHTSNLSTSIIWMHEHSFAFANYSRAQQQQQTSQLSYTHKKNHITFMRTVYAQRAQQILLNIPNVTFDYKYENINRMAWEICYHVSPLAQFTKWMLSFQRFTLPADTLGPK